MKSDSSIKKTGRDRMNALEDVITVAEAAELWGIPKRTLYVDCTGQKGYPPRFTENECRKAAGTWLITRQGMERLYGAEKK